MPQKNNTSSFYLKDRRLIVPHKCVELFSQYDSFYIQHIPPQIASVISENISLIVYPIQGAFHNSTMSRFIDNLSYRKPKERELQRSLSQYNAFINHKLSKTFLLPKYFKIGDIYSLTPLSYIIERERIVIDLCATLTPGSSTGALEVVSP